MDPKLTKDPDAFVSRWVSGFRLGDLVLSFMVFMSGYVLDAWGIQIHGLKSGRTP